MAVLLALAAIMVWLWRGPGTARQAQPPAATSSVQSARADGGDAAPSASASTATQASGRTLSIVRSQSPTSVEDPVPRFDPDDLANYVAPDDPEPTMKEVIDGLHEAGIHTGLGAFNPPGTSPPLPGIAVPDDFVLPEGYVRHHQVTDAGEPIEPILMFSPDFDFLDERGQVIALPDDMVVPPEMVPPGLPIRPVQIPPTP
ncbi:MAG: hypothetical protein ACT4NL_12085 [Pseudomarimonas sp.]